MQRIAHRSKGATSSVPLAALLVFSGALVLACDDGGADPDGDGGTATGQVFVTPDPAADDSAVILKGPYLHAPAQGTVTIGWQTDLASTSRVSWGPEGGSMEEVEGQVYTQQSTTNDPLLAGMQPDGYFHEVVLEGLEPGQTYTYTVLGAAEPRGGTFLAPPDPETTYSFLVFGDSRTGHDPHQRVINGIMDEMAARGRLSFIINTGDMTMTGGSERDWNRFFQIEASLLSDVPTLPVFGNHDFILGRTYFEALFRAPPSSTSPSDRYYSADVGDVHLAVVDIHTMEFEPHLDWLDEDLSSTLAPYKVVAIHPPLFTYSNHAPFYEWRDEIVPILEDNEVQLVVAGHNHCYERFVGYNGYYVTSGGGGAPLYGVDDNLDFDNMQASRIDAAKAYHFVWATVEPSGMTLEVVAGDDGDAPVDTVIDCFRILPGEPVTEDIPCP